MATETVVDLVNEATPQRDGASAHLLEQAAEATETDDTCVPEDQDDASWEHLPAEQRSVATAKVDVYLGDFVSVVQVGPSERRQMLCYLLHQIDRVFHPNTVASKIENTPSPGRIWGK